MAPASARETRYTINDIYALPDGSRVELIDGQIYDVAPPSRKHQRIAGELFAAIREYISGAFHSISCCLIFPY